MASPKYKYPGLAVFLLLLAAGVIGLCVFLVREHHRGNAYAEALRTYESGDLSAAKKKFQAIVSGDGNQEGAYVHLAEIAHREGNWHEEAACWGYARALNSLEAGYRERQKTALAMERNFAALRNLFFSSFNGDAPLSDEDSFYFLLPDESESGNAVRRHYLELLRRERPKFFDTEYGRLLSCIYSGSDAREAVKKLTALGRSANPVIAFEALIRAAALSDERRAAPENVEKLLRTAAEINAFSGLFHLENFYIGQLQFDRAISVCRENFRRFHRPASAVKLAELYVMVGEAEKIGELLPAFARGNKAVLATGCYLEALLAFADNRPEKVLSLFRQVGGLIQTPMSSLINLYCAVSENDPVAMEAAWRAFQIVSAFHDLPARASALMSAGIDSQISAGNLEQAVRLMSLPGVDPFRNLRQSRVLIFWKLRHDTLRENELADALKKFPDDPQLMRSAVEYFYRRREYAKSMEFVNRTLSMDSAAAEVRLFRILNFAALGRHDEAAGLFLEMVKENPGDAALVFAACRFAAVNRRNGDLRSIRDLLKTGKSPLLPYAEGELSLLDGRLPEALAHFGKVREGSPELLFRAAKVLGENDRIAPASALYRELLKRKQISPSLRGVALANLAELYAASGDGDRALECAEKAWRISPSHPAVRLCYARQLRTRGKTEQILSVIPEIPYGGRAGNDLRELWVEAAEIEVVRLYDSGRKAEAGRLCLRLLSAAPESVVGKDLMQKLQPEKERGK